MLKKLATTGFSLMKPNSILGNVFNYADRSKATSMMMNMSAMFADDSQDGTVGLRKNRSDELSKKKTNIFSRF